MAGHTVHERGPPFREKIDGKKRVAGLAIRWPVLIIMLPVFVAYAGVVYAIFGLFKSEVESNEVHALTLKTYTPQQYERITNHVRQ